jgi:lysozyme family protein
MEYYNNIFKKVVMEHEGGCEDNSGDTKDRGGYTRFGISQFWKDYIDIANCTETEAKEFYRKYFFKRICTGYIGLDMFLFDSLVQHDKDACIWLQESIGLAGKQLDGVIGSNTKRRLKDVILSSSGGEITIIKKVASKRMKHYMDLDDDYGRRYHAGWSNRFVDVLSESLNLAVPF